MIRLSRGLAKEIRRHGETAYPNEACGLLIGRWSGTDCLVSRVIESANLAAEPAHRFEVDPAVRFAAMRALRGGPEDIVGHYHSHPDGEAMPSDTDYAMTYEPEMVWLILAVKAGAAAELAAHRVDMEAGRFRRAELEVTV